MSNLVNGNLGYPRIGLNREWKKALESFWSGKIGEDELLSTTRQLRLSHLRKQIEKGIQLIPVNDFTLYDQMLDHAAMFGLVPSRFHYDGGPVSLETYFAMARGNKQATACEMTKWFNTNYHYIVPELQGAAPSLTVNRPLEAYREAKQELGVETKPVLIGLLTFLKLSKGYDPDRFASLADQFLPLYKQILIELEQEGVAWVQIDEPVLAASLFTNEDVQVLQNVYQELHKAAPELNILLQTYFDSVPYYEAAAGLPVQALGLDFVQGAEGNLQAIQRFGFPEDKILGIGIIDGRNIWASDLKEKIRTLESISAAVPSSRWILQPSCSLLHVPVSLEQESGLDSVLKQALAFADEKLDELVLLTKYWTEGSDSVQADLTSNEEAVRALKESAARNHTEVQKAVEQLKNETGKRISPFTRRKQLQQDKWQLPLLPTTTIGSFPQTKEVRQTRLKWRKGDITNEQYQAFIEAEIRDWVQIQEEIGLDVLVHGEFERTDMVEFFGEKLGGFAFTKNGWVQSYGSRCVKPPVIYGDVYFDSPMTVKESVYAQSLTSKPMKGMLTGPVTILNWSFVRDDISREAVANQIALALRKEIEELEKSGIEMIQVDEPALREGLPLQVKDKDGYLRWAVKAFKIATCTVKDTTQIHTHMCYCEFQDVLDSIKAMDADVISIETSRSHGELIGAFEEDTYEQGIGLGVYDIHSPRVPSVEEMEQMIDRALKVLDPSLFWINPDCGLKTRGREETIASLKNMVEATHRARNKQLQSLS